MKPTKIIHDLGQSLWLDNITRDLLNSGTLQRYIDELSVTGLTSNPTIFDHAIRNSADYDGDIAQGAARREVGGGFVFRPGAGGSDPSGRSVPADVRAHRRRRRLGLAGSLAAARPRHRQHAGRGQRLHQRGGKPNLFIKIPGTAEGLPAIEEAIFAGVPVNVTLLFSREQYVAAAEAYLRGVERRIEAGLNPAVASVASVFISRWDVAVAGKVAGRIGQPLGIAIARAHLQGLSRAAGFAALAAGRQRRRAAAAAALGQHRHQGPEGVRHPLRESARRALHGQHDARGDAQGFRRSWRGRRDPCRPTAAMARRCSPSFAKAGIDVDALAARLQDEGAAVLRRNPGTI